MTFMPIAIVVSLLPSLLLTAGAVAAAIFLLALRRENVGLRRRIASLEQISAPAAGPVLERLQQMEERLRVVEARPGPPGVAARSGLNLNTRAQALRMLRRGMPAETVASTLRLARPEVELLVRVRQLEHAAESITSEAPG